jgi:hypothetical protein
MITADEELVSFTLALEEMASSKNDGVGVGGLKFMCRQAAIHLRKCRPDLAFVEHPTTLDAEER